VNPVAALTTCGCPFIATAAGGDDDPFVIVVSCILVLLSFRYLAQIGIAHARDVDALNCRDIAKVCSASSLSHRVLTRQFPEHRCHRLARGRTRHPQGVGGRGLAAVLDYQPARNATTIDPMRALG
jgi:hypothetical protein